MQGQTIGPPLFVCMGEWGPSKHTGVKGAIVSSFSAVSKLQTAALAWTLMGKYTQTLSSQNSQTGLERAESARPADKQTIRQGHLGSSMQNLHTSWQFVIGPWTLPPGPVYSYHFLSANANSCWLLWRCPCQMSNVCYLATISKWKYFGNSSGAKVLARILLRRSPGWAIVLSLGLWLIFDLIRPKL